MLNERELERRARHRLAVLSHAQEVTGSVAATCRYFGIIRQVFYRWKNRYEDEGLDGLKDRSSRPHYSPRTTEVDLVAKIIHLRKTYHFGAQKIAMYLARYHEVTISCSGVWQILKRVLRIYPLRPKDGDRIRRLRRAAFSLHNRHYSDRQRF